MKRVISALLILVMITGMIPVFTQAQEAAVDNGQLTVEGTNSFGNRVSEGVSEVMDTTGDYQAGYSVTGLEITDGIATVTYDTLEDELLVVAIYTEDGTQLLTSTAQTVIPEETEVTVELPEIQDTYFLAEAFLLDTYDRSPLCESFETPMYTSDIRHCVTALWMTTIRTGCIIWTMTKPPTLRFLLTTR